MTFSENSWKWDAWQQEILDHDGNITLRTGRQVGKSVVIAEKAVRFALGNPGTVTLIIAASQRQSSLLFDKVRATIEGQDDKAFAEEPTLTRIVLKNGSKIYSLPAGKTGHFIRGFTLDLLIADEAAYIPEVVWNSVVPMIAVSRKTRGFGKIILLSTPFGKGGYFYDSFKDPDFRAWHVSSENCPRIDRAFLLKEQKRMSKAEYAQEYLGEFVEERDQFFKGELIKRQQTFIEWELKDKVPGSAFYLGIDVARYGGDENAFVICELVGSGAKVRTKIVKCLTTDNVATTDTIGRALLLDNEYHFKKIFVDDAGVGGGVTDLLIEKLGRRVMGLNNASKRVSVQGEERKRGILKEDLYSNALTLLENRRCELIADSALEHSMKSMTFEYTSDVNVKIFGNDSHLCEAMVRALWCTKERGLDIYCF